MKVAMPSARGVAVCVSSLLLLSRASAQTYSTCDPLRQTCPADPGLGGTSDTSFTSGESSQYTGTGDSISYNSAGAQLSVATSGNNPTLVSNWYIMFGHVDFTFKAAPGVGMVSSAILLSDDLDEIDWEILGADATQAQTNYFYQGETGSYDRGGFASVGNSQTDFNTYSIDWTADQISWLINGATVRTLTAAEANGQYPQTPMQVKIGAWAGGDSSNAPGTIEWAGGPINYADGPYVMQVQSINVQDYSTGKQYQYDGTSGTWESITAIGGTVNSGGSSSDGDSSPTPVSDSPYTATFAGTHQETSAYVTPSEWPWVASATGSSDSLATAGPPASSYLASLGYDNSSVPSKTAAPTSYAPSSAPTSLAASVPGSSSMVTAASASKPSDALATAEVAAVTSYSASNVFNQGVATSLAAYSPGNGAGRIHIGPMVVILGCLTAASAVFL